MKKFIFINLLFICFFRSQITYAENSPSAKNSSSLLNDLPKETLNIIIRKNSFLMNEKGKTITEEERAKNVADSVAEFYKNAPPGYASPGKVARNFIKNMGCKDESKLLWDIGRRISTNDFSLDDFLSQLSDFSYGEKALTLDGKTPLVTLGSLNFLNYRTKELEDLNKMKATLTEYFKHFEAVRKNNLRPIPIAANLPDFLKQNHQGETTQREKTFPESLPKGAFEELIPSRKQDDSNTDLSYFEKNDLYYQLTEKDLEPMRSVLNLKGKFKCAQNDGNPAYEYNMKGQLLKEKIQKLADEMGLKVMGNLAERAKERVGTASQTFDSEQYHIQTLRENVLSELKEEKEQVETKVKKDIGDAAKETLSNLEENVKGHKNSIENHLKPKVDFSKAFYNDKGNLIFASDECKSFNGSSNKAARDYLVEKFRDRMAAELAKLDIADQILPSPKDPKAKDPNTASVIRYLEAKKAAIEESSRMTYILCSESTGSIISASKHYGIGGADEWSVETYDFSYSSFLETKSGSSKNKNFDNDLSNDEKNNIGPFRVSGNQWRYRDPFRNFIKNLFDQMSWIDKASPDKKQRTPRTEKSQLQFLATHCQVDRFYANRQTGVVDRRDELLKDLRNSLISLSKADKNDYKESGTLKQLFTFQSLCFPEAYRVADYLRVHDAPFMNSDRDTKIKNMYFGCLINENKNCSDQHMNGNDSYSPHSTQLCKETYEQIAKEMQDYRDKHRNSPTATGPSPLARNTELMDIVREQRNGNVNRIAPEIQKNIEKIKTSLKDDDDVQSIISSFNEEFNNFNNYPSKSEWLKKMNDHLKSLKNVVEGSSVSNLTSKAEATEALIKINSDWDRLNLGYSEKTTAIAKAETENITKDKKDALNSETISSSIAKNPELKEAIIAMYNKTTGENAKDFDSASNQKVLKEIKTYLYLTRTPDLITRFKAEDIQKQIAGLKVEPNPNVNPIAKKAIESYSEMKNRVKQKKGISLTEEEQISDALSKIAKEKYKEFIELRLNAKRMKLEEKWKASRLPGSKVKPLDLETYYEEMEAEIDRAVSDLDKLISEKRDSDYIEAQKRNALDFEIKLQENPYRASLYKAEKEKMKDLFLESK